MNTTTLTQKELIARILKKPDSFAYYGDKDMFNTWGYLPIGVTTRDDRDTLNESNQCVIFEDLKSINPNHVEIQNNSHWACGWVKQIAIKVYHDGKLTKVAKKAIEWVKELEEGYPVADDCDYSDREADAMAGDIEFYKDDFIKEILTYFNLKERPKGVSRKSLHNLAADIYAEDCGYRGRDDAFVTPDSIDRYLADKYSDRSYHEKTLKKLTKK
ncbi:hypothetical protein E6Q11_02425 [Candidatus Dojkabacteria bacterium]|uniref:Uncharacterized protein n=1 Tax=Candidatus Dojkabacteria bacterium TaxID=2099670 RepID=A0A5C7J931_9BACT|nr:MAG: hypothetical protein E6Q11_02425 [Candidatus Dojkabacteria bacterium]